MALFSRSSRPPATPEEAGGERLSAPAFRQLLQSLEREPGRKYRILDLARASGNHVTFFSRFRCRLQVAALAEELPAWRLREEDPPPDPARLLPLPPEARFDLVLCWNLLDYLEPEPLSLLLGHLLPHLGPGSWLHAFIQTRGEMPSQPGEFLLLEDGQMEWRHDPGSTIQTPRHSRRTLERWLPGVRVRQSRLLQNGFQEYLFQVT